MTVPSNPVSPPQWQRWLGVASHISKRNVVGFILHATASVLFLVLLNSLQPGLISQLVNAETEPGSSGSSRRGHSSPAPADDRQALVQLGRLNSTLLLVDECASIILVLLWGSIAELLGIRAVASIGYLFIALALVGYAFARNAGGHLLVARLVFAVGASAVTSMLSASIASITAMLPPHQRGSSYDALRSSITEETPLLPPPADTEQAAGGSSQAPSRPGAGKLASIAGIFTGVGALIAVFGLDRIPPMIAAWLDDHPQHHWTSAMDDDDNLLSLFVIRAERQKRKHAIHDANLHTGLRLTFLLCAVLAVIVSGLLVATLPRREVSISQLHEGAAEAAARRSIESERENVTPSAAAEAAFDQPQPSRWRRSFISRSAAGGGGHRQTASVSASAASHLSEERVARRLRLRERLARGGRRRRTLYQTFIKLCNGLTQGLIDARSNPTLITAYIGGAMARATTVGTSESFAQLGYASATAQMADENHFDSCLPAAVGRPLLLYVWSLPPPSGSYDPRE